MSDSYKLRLAAQRSAAQVCDARNDAICSFAGNIIIFIIKQQVVLFNSFLFQLAFNLHFHFFVDFIEEQ